jgi:competence protein ComEC
MPPATRFVAVVLAFAALGSGVAGARMALLDSGALVERGEQGGQAEVVATVVTDARPALDGVWLIVRVRTLDGIGVRRRALVRLGDDEAPPLGSRVAFGSTVRPLDHDDFEGYLRSLHVAVELDPVTPLQTLRGPPLVLRMTNAVRHRVRVAAAAHLPGDHAAVLSGLVTGDTTGLSEAAQDFMLAAGLTHLVAVSGSNVALVLAGVVGLAAAAGFGARGRRRIATLGLVWFVVLVRGEPSVLRAAVMALLVLAASGLGRGHDAKHTLAVAATLLLLADPFLAGQLGFALSVLATAGVLVVAPAVVARLPGPRPLALLVGASIGAQLGVAPVLLAGEGLPLGALPANLLAVPAAAVASAIGVVAALVAQILPAVGALLATLALPALSVVLAAGRVFSDGPALTAQHLLSPVAVVLLGGLVVRRRAPLLAAASVAVVVVVAVGGPWRQPPVVRSLTLTALDVGQGDALLVEVPGPPGGAPARMLVDGGPDAGRAVALLRQRGIGFLDAVVVSHPHADHTNGLPGVLTRVRTGALLVGPTPPRDLDDPSASALATEVVAGQHEVPVVRVAAGQRFTLGSASVEILSPPADGSVGREPNDNSLVFRLATSDGALLLTGDAEEAAQARLLQRPDLLRADVLKVPHHGGNTNATGFLDAVGATTAVIGVGADNDYGHPHPDVLADLTGSTILRTDTGGTVTVQVP